MLQRAASMGAVTFLHGVCLGALGIALPMFALGWWRRGQRATSAQGPRAERVLQRRSERMERLSVVAELAAIFAHEVKNPLAPMRGYAQMLSGRLDAVQPEQRAIFEKGLGVIMHEVDRLNARIEQVLSRTQARRAAGHEECQFDLTPVLSDVFSLIEMDPGVREIHFISPSQPVIVAGDPELIRAAVLNLVKNAAEAMAESAPADLHVEVDSSGEQVALHIRDEGPGLGGRTDEELSTAFFTTKESGTGLGLAIARSDVEQMGGQLHLRNRDDAPGAWAELRLPKGSPASA